MKYLIQIILFLTYIANLLLLQGCDSTISTQSDWNWKTINTIGEPVARHEAGMIAYKDKILLIGGRRINPTSEYNISTNTWTDRSPTPIELHHFQPVVIDDAIYLIGAMTGEWPNEKPLDRVIIYYPKKDEYIYSHEIPQHRRRGGTGAVVYKDKIYLVGGITNGHMDGYQPWLDEYDPKTGIWNALDDAPNARDHFQAVVLKNKLYAFAGRRTSKKTNEDLALTTSHGNVYDFTKGKWETVTNDKALPILRAGNSAFVWNNQIIIGGGESIIQESAHDELEAFNIETNSWSNWPSLQEGRHGTGFAIIDDHVYIASGSGNRGGGPELTTIERLKLPSKNLAQSNKVVDTTPVYLLWHTITIPFTGPETSENDAQNPFLNYRLNVEFKHENSKYTIRGFYAADGNSAESSAATGPVWQVRFTPDQPGNWTYSATLHNGENIAIDDDLNKGVQIDIPNSVGNFIVIVSDKDGVDFRNHGRLEASKGFFKFRDSNEYWIKGGTNSPENLLGYIDFDGTYRIDADVREGEAAAADELHKFEPHLADWKIGNPIWQNGKGKSLIGAINYLASMGMNTSYFLTLNILGDGKDVWPYNDPEDFTRFDVSKLAQWEILFQHMQAKGILLHMVLQETENELMLDDGNTGPMRQLYFQELIARFGHHLALTWNLGEENGPAPWSPKGQNDAQRKAMASFLKQTDPYQHPVLLHTHAHDPLRSDILNQVLGFKYIDGLSLQTDERKEASVVVQTWKNKSDSIGWPWLITMDEIGKWHTGALPDSEDSNHYTLRRYALWGTLLSGAAGVEWYFGAKHPHNDLTSEDWRERNRLWQLTNHALRFFKDHLPYWRMEPNHQLINSINAYCLREIDKTYAIYLPKVDDYTINLNEAGGKFNVKWYDPLNGGELQNGSIETIIGGTTSGLGKPPKRSSSNHDWIVLLKKVSI